jgi:PAS domain S-box-containing protein
MNEITKVALENEMDLILAHKQSMRLAELTGLSLPAQTTFATAVSEVSRTAIGQGQRAYLTLYVSDKYDKQKYLTAVLTDNRAGYSEALDEGYKYAKRLVQQIKITTHGKENKTELCYRLLPNLRIDDTIIGKWRISLNTDPAVSPYEEIKRKNRQLVQLADRLKESEQQYVSLTDSLPMMIFSMDIGGVVTYSNQWLIAYTGQTLDQINSSRWKDILHPDDFEEIWHNWDTKIQQNPDMITMERRLREAKTGDYRWHTGSIIPIVDAEGSTTSWNVFMVDIDAQRTVETTLRHNAELKAIQEQLEEKVNLLHQSNQQLEQFAYIASHDLQEPLRKISFYSDFLKKKYGPMLPEEGSVFFDNLIGASERMKLLIQDVLTYSTVRKENFAPADLNRVVAEAIQDLEISISEKHATINVGKLPMIDGNKGQLKQLFENLISNALKFSAAGRPSVIDISAAVKDGCAELVFADNGIGFEDIYISKMFTLFQRLNARDKYSGTGIGLAICKKIVDAHGGAVSAMGKLGEGAVFTITLPLKQENAATD